MFVCLSMKKQQDKNKSPNISVTFLVHVGFGLSALVQSSHKLVKSFLFFFKIKITNLHHLLFFMYRDQHTNAMVSTYSMTTAKLCFLLLKTSTLLHLCHDTCLEQHHIQQKALLNNPYEMPGPLAVKPAYAR